MTTTVWNFRNAKTGGSFITTLEYRWSLLEAIDNRKAKAFYKQHSVERIVIDMYACGWLKPNYPMPAIPYNVRITKEYVAIGVPETIWNGNDVVRFIPKLHS